MLAIFSCRPEATCDNSAKETTVYPFRRAAGRLVARGCATLGLAATLFLAGCHNFFICEKASCPSSGSTNYAYVSNSSSGSSYVAEYDVANGSLAAISGSPFNMGFSPVALSIGTSNTFLYAATPSTVTNPGIYLFSIGSTGALSTANSGNAVISGTFATMDVSPDGNYLFAVDILGTSLYEYTINSSTGLLGLAATIPLPTGISACALSSGTPVSQTCTVKAAPSGEFVVVSLGTTGTAIYTYSSSSGITTTSPKIIPSGSTQTAPSGDFSVTLDANNFVYIARTSALAVWQITDSSGDASQVFNQTYGNTAVPRSVVLGSGGGVVYTANEGAGNISAFSIGSGGALTAISGSPFAGPANASAIGVDTSGKYMVAGGYNSSSGVQLFSIGSNGGLTLITSAGTGTSTTIPAVLAMTH